MDPETLVLVHSTSGTGDFRRSGGAASGLSKGCVPWGDLLELAVTLLGGVGVSRSGVSSSGAARIFSVGAHECCSLLGRGVVRLGRLTAFGFKDPLEFRVRRDHPFADLGKLRQFCRVAHPFVRAFLSDADCTLFPDMVGGWPPTDSPAAVARCSRCDPAHRCCFDPHTGYRHAASLGRSDVCPVSGFRWACLFGAEAGWIHAMISFR